MSTKKEKLRLFVQKGEGEINIKVDWVFVYVLFSPSTYSHKEKPGIKVNLI